MWCNSRLYYFQNPVHSTILKILIKTLRETILSTYKTIFGIIEYLIDICCMIAVITGDIIGSRNAETPDAWNIPLKQLLKQKGKSPVHWEIFRGDSFQVELSDPADALLKTIHIKSTMLSIKGLNVRMAIGIGKKEYTGASISESYGEAYVFSGQTLDKYKKSDKTLAVKSPWPDFDRDLNVCIGLALLTMDKWTTVSAEFVKLMLDNPGISQMAMAKKLGIAQSSVSARKKRAGIAEILEMNELYQSKYKDYSANPD